MQTLRHLLSDLSSRSTLKENMDSSDSDNHKLMLTLSQFKWINRYMSGMHGLLQKTIIADMKSQNEKREFRILDIGCGGCDIPIWLALTCKKHNLHTTLFCVDHDPRVVKYAQSVCSLFSNISVLEKPAYHAISELHPDYIISNHFLHHLEDEVIASLLQDAYNHSTRGIVMNDISRSRSSLWIFCIVSLLFFHKSYSCIDGLISIRKGFTRNDLLNVADKTRIPLKIELVRPGHICAYALK